MPVLGTNGEIVVQACRWIYEGGIDEQTRGDISVAMMSGPQKFSGPSSCIFLSVAAQ